MNGSVNLLRKGLAHGDKPFSVFEDFAKQRAVDEQSSQFRRKVQMNVNVDLFAHGRKMNLPHMASKLRSGDLVPDEPHAAAFP